MLQVAVALMLLVGAGLLMRSFEQLLDVNPGFQTRNLLTISTQVPMSGRRPERADRELPAHEGSFDERARSAQRLRGQPRPDDGDEPHELRRNRGQIHARRAGARKSSTALQRPITSRRWGFRCGRGRIFDAHDDPNAASVVVINETMARMFWPGESAVGKRIKRAPVRPGRVDHRVGRSRGYSALRPRRRSAPEMYRPYSVNPLNAPVLLIRTDADAAALAQTLAATVRRSGRMCPRTTSIRCRTWWIVRPRSGVSHAGAGRVCGLRAAVGRSRRIRNGVTGRGAADARDRCAHGAGASPAAALALVFRDGAALAALGIGLARSRPPV